MTVNSCPPLAFLHTARPNNALFSDLIQRIDPTVTVHHELVEAVMLEAAGTGTLTGGMRDRTETTIRSLAYAGARLIVCTCSTIGAVAESTVLEAGKRVMRIDRPMAEAAVSSGRRVVVATTLRSTVEPTMNLLQQVAAEMAKGVELTELACEPAWAHYERGDLDAYAAAIADCVTRGVGSDDQVVLAQASMAPAAALLATRGIAALSSPELGVRAALEAYRRSSN